MTHACCLGCRVRVKSVSPAECPPCPACGRPMTAVAAAQSIGYRLATPEPLPMAVTVAMSALPARLDLRR
jgi:hypothetical protein